MIEFYFQIIGRFTIAAFVGVLIPLLVSCFVVKEEERRNTIVLLGALSLVGASAGIAGGMSRAAAVGDIVPAFLGLLGGVAIYLFGVDSSKGLVASFGATALSISLLVSYFLASELRNKSDDHREIRAICAKAYTNADLLGNQEAFKKFLEKMGNQCHKSMWWDIR